MGPTIARQHTPHPIAARHASGLAVLALLGLVCSSSLPRITPELARTSGCPVQLQGANGPLSAARSKLILDKLERRGQAIDYSNVIWRWKKLSSAVR